MSRIRKNAEELFRRLGNLSTKRISKIKITFRYRCYPAKRALPAMLTHGR